MLFIYLQFMPSRLQKAIEHENKRAPYSKWAFPRNPASTKAWRAYLETVAAELPNVGPSTIEKALQVVQEHEIESIKKETE